MKTEALAVLRAIGDRETSTGLVSVGDLIDATGLDPEVVVNELERLLRSGYVTGKLQRLISGGDPRPWFIVNPLLSERGFNLLEQRAGQAPLPDVGAAVGQREPTAGHWDAFISHAHEDKAAFVTDLAHELTASGLRIWYDDDILEVGDSVRRAIDNGLRESEFGIVIISKVFMRKDWTNHELDGILALERGQNRLLPVWHGVEHAEVAEYSPIVAGIHASRSAEGVARVADDLRRAMHKGAGAVIPAVTEKTEGESRLDEQSSHSGAAHATALPASTPTTCDREPQEPGSQEANRAAMRQRFDDLLLPAVVSVIAAARALQAAANARSPLSLEQVSVLDAPMDLFDLHPETRELAAAVTELRHNAMIYRVQAASLIARSAEMKEATRLSLRPDLGLAIERLSDEVGHRAEQTIAAAVAVRSAASKVVAGHADPAG